MCCVVQRSAVVISAVKVVVLYECNVTNLGNLMHNIFVLCALSTPVYLHSSLP